MRYISAANLTFLQGSYLPLCMCVKMTLRDGTVKGFTDLDADITVDAVLYRAKVGMSVGALRWTNRLDTEKTELEGIFSALTGGVTEADARIGLYNHALVEIFLARWDTSALVVKLKRGRLTNLIPNGTGYSAEVRSLVHPLNKKLIVEEVTHDCNAELGDARCTKAVLSYNGTVTSSADNSTVTASGFGGPATASDLVGGRFVFTSGSFTWFVNKIKTYNGGTKVFTFWKPFPAAVSTWNFTAYEGCDLKPATCKDRFNNLVNYRGFHFVPDKDETAIPIGPTIDNGGYAAGNGEAD